MNKQWLEAFVSVSQTKNVSQAAQNLFLTQPSVSSRIQLLEQEIGESLFYRADRRMILTEAGRTLLPYAQELLDTWGAGHEAVRQLQNRMEGTVTIALFFSSISFLSPCLIDFTTKYPDVKLKIHTAHSEEVGELVLNRDAQIGIARALNRPPLQSRSIISDNYVMAVSSDHPIVKRPDDLEDNIRKGPFIISYSSRFDKESFLDFIKNRNFESNLIIETNNLEICKQYVLQNMGIAFMPRFYIDADITSGNLVALESIPESVIPSRSIDMIWLKHNENYRVISTLLDHIIQYDDK